DSVMPVMLNN
ncbi:hypothetical protein I8752_21930, partial [Nostocaceae cyanobacterium CENA369]|nr:hypothetical protein [Dendronalium phyllosphericum CENA369]